jgi:type I restriction enzyme M protein
MLGFEKKLWRAAAKLRNNMNAAEYEHVVLALKHVSDAFEQKHAAHEGERTSGAGQERDAYRAKNNFWVPKEPCRSFLETTAKQPMTVADALLPRLLAGDLQVRAAARELEATV